MTEFEPEPSQTPSSWWRRRLWLYLVVILIVLVAIALAWWFSGKHFSVVPAPDAPPKPNTSAMHGYGLSVDLTGLSDQQLDQQLTAFKALGVSWLRFDLSWSQVQASGRDSYNWSTYDRIIPAVNAHGLKTIAILDFTPEWARDSACQQSDRCRPASAPDFAAFAAVAAQRYSSQDVAAWEIWNEPNIAYRFQPSADVAEYVSMLQRSDILIHKAVPSAVVLAGSTAPSATDSKNYRPDDFIRAIYASGAKGYFDAIAAHPYTFPQSPADNIPSNAWGQLATMRSLMQSHGDGAKQIWVTEFGAPSAGRAGASEAVQNSILSDAVRIYKGYSWGGPFIWYTYQDSATATASSPEGHFGLLRADGSQKPAFATLQTATKGP